MTSKEYKERLANHWQSDYWDCLTPEDRKALRQSMKRRQHDGEEILCDKASIKSDERGLVLTSYYTDVCCYKDGKFTKLWEGWSATTSKHVNMFCRKLRIPRIGKREWVGMDCNVEYERR